MKSQWCLHIKLVSHLRETLMVQCKTPSLQCTVKAEIFSSKIFLVKAKNNVLVVRTFLVQHGEVIVLLVVKSLCKSMQLLTVILGCHAQDCWLHKF
jgi:hypothetical protein